jgi:hypothetical protein
MHRRGSCLFACLFMCLNVLLCVCVLTFVSVYVCVVSLHLPSLSLSLSACLRRISKDVKMNQANDNRVGSLFTLWKKDQYFKFEFFLSSSAFTLFFFR